MGYYYSFDPVGCALRPVGSSVLAGGLFSAWDASQGRRVTPQTFAIYAGAVYVYNLLQCPMEAASGGRPSAWHNVASGAILGYIGVQKRVLGVPFLDSYFFYRNPQISPELAAAGIYGGIAGALAAFGGKPF